jgi:hypothetical protein
VKVTAKETITMQNDGHAVVDFNAKDIVIANNSTNTLIGNIGTAGTESIVIGTGKITVDGIDTDGYGDVDGSIKNAVITATEISIDNQQVENTTVTGSTVSIDNIVFKGDNTINSQNYSTNGADITIGAGASLTATGGRWTLGGDANWDIDGNIVDAKELTDEEKANLKASLNVAGLSLSTSGGEALMDVDNAYVVLSSYSSNKNNNVTGGKITMDFNNSVVDSNGKIEIGRTKLSSTEYDPLYANAPEIALNVTDSIFNVKGYFMNNHVNSTVNIDNSDFTATAFGNVSKGS